MSDSLRPDDTTDGERLAGSLTRQRLLSQAAVGGALVTGTRLELGARPLRAKLEERAAAGGVLKMARNEEAQSFDPIVAADNA